MDKAVQGSARHRHQLDWRRRMSDHIAYALLVYTSLQIFVTVHALKAGSSGILPYLALIVLVLLIIPACRKFEKRWQVLDDVQASDPSYTAAFKRDRMLLWALAILLPLFLTGLFKGITAII